MIVASRDIYGYGRQMAPLAYSKSVFYSIFGRLIICRGQINTRTLSRGLKWRFFVFFSPFFSILAAFSLISAHIKATNDTLMDFLNKKDYLEQESGTICTIGPGPKFEF